MITRFIGNDLNIDLLETISTYTWSKNYYFNSLSLILVRCTKTGYDVTCSKNGVTCKQRHT